MWVSVSTAASKAPALFRGDLLRLLREWSTDWLLGICQWVLLAPL